MYSITCVGFHISNKSMNFSSIFREYEIPLLYYKSVLKYLFLNKWVCNKSLMCDVVFLFQYLNIKDVGRISLTLRNTFRYDLIK